MASTQSDKFYLGRLFDLKQGNVLPQQVFYDPADLTTHAVITGMTGSGKTGLGVILLEEAALKGIPAIIIDPKGDLTNLALHFPKLSPEDFEPWMDLEAPGNRGKAASVLAQEAASRWQSGLADWGLGAEDILRLQKAVERTIYTPGSASGVPVNILTSFDAPRGSWEENSEALREKIASTITALLGLVGMTDIDPLRSREHILLSAILEHAWSQGQSLTLVDLILQVQKPPFDRLGAFAVDSFFPEKNRMDLAMLLNNFLASPSFQVWQQGAALDVGSFLYTEAGMPRHSIFYLAHLSENERMFFVTLLFASIEAWTRAQRGTSGLRALVYMDEILGYLPPIANPPSRAVMLRMLKQARAFGVGLVLATQNPVDVDYKALSNAGTWLVGRLQTEQDRDRLLDGLLSASGQSDRSELARMISALQKRVFLLHNVHTKGAQIFHTRWTMNFLAGPMTRAQIPALNQLVGVETRKAAPLPQAEATSQQVAASVSPAAAVLPSPTSAQSHTAQISSARPVFPSEIEEYFLPNDRGVSEAAAELNLSAALQAEGVCYRAVLFAQAEVRYVARQYGLDYARRIAVAISEAESSMVRWEEHEFRPYALKELQRTPLPQAQFYPAPAWLMDVKRVKALQRDFEDWVYREGVIRLRANSKLKVFAGPQVSSAEFRELCSEAARKAADLEIQKVESVYSKKLEALQQRISRQTLEVKEQQEQLSHRKLEQYGKMGETVLGLLGGRKRSLSSAIGKVRMTQQSKVQLEQEEQELEALRQQYRSQERAYQEAVNEIRERWAQMVNDISEIPLTPAKKDIFVEAFGVAWLPYYQFKVGSELKEAPAFKTS
ncbi:MAG: ATP-binding protein [Anaerolineae bacterium]|nr:ATP-binding protein [Anaerolineae bacterium]